jgi:hypothetical protein
VLEEYRGIYRDRHGEESVIIRNDGQKLSMTIRGVDFSGHSMDGMEPTDKSDRPALANFILNQYSENACHLCACRIAYEVPLPVIDREQIIAGVLTVHLDLGTPAERGFLDRESLCLTLTVGADTYRGSGVSGWFEGELLEIQKILPDGMYMKACINCAFSDYSVYGHGLFGGMPCFRNQKGRYLSVKTKDQYMDIMDDYAQIVQETYLCPEFERRAPGTGYRG